MSLYDMYFSKRNKNYMYETISKLIKDELNIDISHSPKHIELYRQNYSTIFENINTDELSVLNRELINHMGQIYLRENIFNQDTLNIEETKQTDKYNTIIQKTYKNHIIHSSQRNKNSLNRYNFSVDVDFTELKPKKITMIKENNNLFSNPTIIVQFNNSENLQFTLLETKIYNNKEYYTYECSTDDIIKCQDVLNIKILNYLMISPLDNPDVYNIKLIKKINYENKDYLCLEITKHDIRENDELGLLEFNDKSQQIVKSLFVKKCLKNYILTDLEDIDLDKSYTCLQLNKNIEIHGLV